MFIGKLAGAVAATTMTIALAIGGQAAAATVSFTSTANFSSVGGPSGCQVGCGVSSGGNVYTIGTNYFGADSTLTTYDYGANTFNTDATAVRLGEITWNNQATPSYSTDPNFNLNYALTLNFSQPTDLAPDTTTFVLNVSQPTNPPGDSITNMNIGIPNIGPFALAGVTISNIRWVLVSGGTGPNASTFNSATGAWFNPENHTATLRLVADFTATPVPEPASFAILGAGLLGLAAARRARRLN